MEYLSLRLLKYLFIIGLFFSTFSFYAQQNHGKIKGHITTSEGKPASDVNIVLKNSKYGTTTDEDGNFEISRVRENNYILEISLAGYETSEKEVLVESNKTAVINVQLKVSNKELQEVVINNKKSLLSKKTQYVARMPLKNIENPQVYNVIHKELIQEQIVIDVAGAIRNAPGVVPLNYPSGGFAVIFRGFTVGINSRNGMETLSGRSSVGIANVERIEILKGPSGTLFGSSASSFGGVVNLVTKKPFEASATEISYTAGSYGVNRLTVDINTPLTKDKKVLFRLNAAVNNEKSFLDYGFNKTLSFTPSITFKASEKLTFNIDAELFKVNSTKPLFPAATATSGIINPRDIKLDYKKSLVHDDADAKSSSSKAFVQAEYQISDRWKSTTLYSYVNEDVAYSYQVLPTWTSPTTATIRATLFGPISSNYTNIQENINGEFSSGILKHKILIGANYRYYTDTFSSTPTPATPFRTIDVTTNFAPIRKNEIDKVLLAPVIRAGRDEYTFSGYASYVLGVADRLYAMASLRLDNFDRKESGTVPGYSQNSLSPKLGIVYQVIKDQVSVFGNYMNGFQNLAPVQQPSGDQLILDPLYANQYEAGIKTELFNKKISTTISYYKITNDNAVIRQADLVYQQDGKQVSKGVEFEFLANPIPGLDITAGYAYNDNRIVKTSEANKAIEGNKAQDAPGNVANFWASYKFQNVLKGFGIGVGANYVDKSYMSTANTFYIPSYTIFNQTVFYEQASWRVGLKLNNLTNEKYWSSWGAPQPPANFLINLTFKF
ncbi:iron complex outermembrane recepter protein [Flavobacterium aquidurense]|uniref:TonB-dependent siderophore receptor n=1 Tax=Flavobacterium frigidimaris TaxID=262320 RepID=A0ABX4BWN6_FLAFR|nr:TonB-dependent receptor [Flavobacterium frigidimaris]OXA82077.1 TonB-dependent siderophore receptor [Flavobacterium frigidimaris]SDY53917.1 iron complex outermembrane recepter protein [Flavobacterium aquidurense]